MSQLERIKATPDTIPPAGWIKAIVEEDDGTSDLYWVNPTQLKMGTPISELTPEQVRTVEVIQRSLSDVDDTPLEGWIYNFSCNRNPANEIGIFAGIVKLIEQERPYRRGSELKDVYAATIFLSMIGSGNRLNNLLSSYPQAKRIKNLERVVSRWEQLIN